MYLVDFKAIITQLLPPVWRKTWIESIISAFFAPIASTYRRFLTFKKYTSEEIRMNGQVKVIESHLSRITNTHSSLVYLRNGSEILSIEIVAPADISEEKKQAIRQFMERYKPVGTTFTIQASL